jgi:hypothetical protein
MTSNRPNLKFVARPTWDKERAKKLSDPSPVEAFTYKGEMVRLPSAAEQRAKPFFYHERADLILSQYPFLYKRVVRK